MNCKDCGLEVANIGELNRHRKECAVRNHKTEGTHEKKVVIPWDACDSTLRVLSLGTLVTGVFIGAVGRDGIEVQEVHPLRRGRKTS